jgi:Flp pilus assembly protein TadG
VTVLSPRFRAPWLTTRALRRGVCRCAGDGQRGSNPVEFAIVAGAMLMLAFITVQAALVFYAQSVALGAATQGVNAARGYLSNAGAGEDHARDFLTAAGTGLTGQRVSASRSATEVSVTVSGRAISVLPGLNFAVRRTAHGPVERVTEP